MSPNIVNAFSERGCSFARHHDLDLQDVTVFFLQTANARLQLPVPDWNLQHYSRKVVRESAAKRRNERKRQSMEWTLIEQI